MKTAPTALKKVVVVAHPLIPEAQDTGEEIVRQLEAQGVTAVFDLLNKDVLLSRIQQDEFDLMIALGGDGTMLRAGHVSGPRHLPVLGINVGHFGFLMEMRFVEWPACFARLLQGDYWLESRMMLCAEHWRGEERLSQWDVLNEVVVCQGETVRPIKLATYLDERYLTTYVADALIAATPTGSTAYALAAGGPILPPELRNILLLPVAPHLSLDRPIILAEGASVSIRVQSDHQAVFSADGQTPVHIEEEDRLDVRAGEHTVKFVRFQDPGYFYRNLTPHMNQNPATGGTR